MKGLIVTAPEKAQCGLYAGVPGARLYHKAIDPKNAIPATEIRIKNGTATYYYEDLEVGVYHCAASMEGYNALCQTVNYTAPTQIDMKLDKLAGNGFELGCVMQYTREFIENQLTSDKNAWGEEYAKLFVTPQFQPGRPGRHQQTTNEELEVFIAKLAQTNSNMHIFSLGKSPRYGYNMPLVLFTKENIRGMTLEQAAEVIRGNGKPTIQYNAQCHATEPASTEGALAMMAALCGDYGKVLEDVDIYIIPRINLDGAYKAIRQSPTTGEDMNRDYLYLNNKELHMVVGAYNLFRPEVCIDGHERFHRFNYSGEDICTDMELQTGAGSLLHPHEMTEMAVKMALTAIEKGRGLGLRCHFYGKLASAAGGAAGSSYFGIRNSLSFLVETPGQVNHGMCFMERRVLAHYVFASSVMDFTAENRHELMATVHTSRSFMSKVNRIYDENNPFVIEHDEAVTGNLPAPLIHVPSGKVTDPDHTEDYKEQTIALITRPRATAYVLPKGLASEAEILRVAGLHSLTWYELPAGSTVSLKQYLKNDEEFTMTQEQEFCFEQGAWVFPNTTDCAVLNVIMEPDFNPSKPEQKKTLYRMGFISPDDTGKLPLYRYCHTLENGKI